MGQTRNRHPAWRVPAERMFANLDKMSPTFRFVPNIDPERVSVPETNHIKDRIQFT